MFVAWCHHQAINWTNIGQVLCRHVGSSGVNESIYVKKLMLICSQPYCWAVRIVHMTPQPRRLASYGHWFEHNCENWPRNEKAHLLYCKANHCSGRMNDMVIAREILLPGRLPASISASTVYWCIASKLKAPRIFYWMSNVFVGGNTSFLCVLSCSSEEA